MAIEADVGGKVAGASETGHKGRFVDREKVTSWLSKVFELNPEGLNWPRGVMLLDVELVPVVVLWALGDEVYLLSVVSACCSPRWLIPAAATRTERRTWLCMA